MNQNILEVAEVSKSYYQADKAFTSIENVSLDIDEGEFLCVIGPSGCGKSTLLRMIAGLTEPTTGTVRFRGEAIRRPHPKISMVFQNFGLLPWKTVLENVELGLKIQGIPKENRRLIAREHIEKVGLRDFENNYPGELSGGMKQRVGFARALATKPEVILLDEPFSALDEITATGLRKEVSRVWREIQETFVMVTHSITEAVELASRVLVLSPSPARVKDVVKIELPQPRRKTDSEYEKYESKLFRLLEEELGGLYDMEGHPTH